MRDDFSEATKIALAKGAAYICSNPECRRLTVAPSESDESKLLYIGCAAHIMAASEGGPRYDASLSPDQRKSVDNGIYLCRSCADMIDKNDGVDFPSTDLLSWKQNHSSWLQDNLNKEFGGSIMGSIQQLREEVKSLKVDNNIVNVLDRSFELQKKLKTMAIVVELKESIKISEQKPFVCLVHVHCIGVGDQPSFVAGVAYPSDLEMQFIVGGKSMPSGPLEMGWSNSPEALLSQVAMHRSNNRKNYVSKIRINDYNGLDRAIDLDGAKVFFYLSDNLIEQAAMVYFIVNDFIVESFTPSELEEFPAKTNLENAYIGIPKKISTRLPEEVRLMPITRLGRKGGDPEYVAQGFADVESIWFLKYPEQLIGVNNLSKIR